MRSWQSNRSALVDGVSENTYLQNLQVVRKLATPCRRTFGYPGKDDQRYQRAMGIE